jgi:cytochrome c-type biogenesis protein CcmH/NrfF
MRRLRSSVLLIALACLALAQDASKRQSVDVLRVGHRLACLCGCSDTFSTCSMLECGFCKPAKARIARMQQAGMSDQQIIDTFVKEHGPQIYREEPNALGWIVPYAALLPGIGLVFWFVRRYYKPRPAAAGAAAPENTPYDEQIEKELANLE